MCIGIKSVNLPSLYDCVLVCGKLDEMPGTGTLEGTLRQAESAVISGSRISAGGTGSGGGGIDVLASLKAGSISLDDVEPFRSARDLGAIGFSAGNVVSK